jgi:Increased loss of mitochondrial DNA protein 1
MPLISSHILILAHSLTCLTTSFILFSNPPLITSSAPVWLLGEAMHIKDTRSFSLASEPLAALALLLTVLAVVESVFAGSLVGLGSFAKRGDSGRSIQAFAEKAAILHNVQGQWMMISTAKTLVFGLLVMYSYLTSRRGQGMGYIIPPESNAGGLGLSMLNNRVVFVSMFTEMMFWGYLWTVLKEEKKDLASGIKVRKEEEREKGHEAWD